MYNYDPYYFQQITSGYTQRRIPLVPVGFTTDYIDVA